MKAGFRLLVVMGILAAGLIVLASPAQAIVFQFTSDHCTGGCGTAPFGTVTVTQNGANVDVTVALAAGYSFVKTGSSDFQDFKFNATGVVLGDITVDAHVPVLVAQTGAFNGDGTGDFAFGITCPSCGNGGAGAFTAPITFHVANATISDITQPNNLGNIFVADVLAPNGNTGPVDVNTVAVPEPSSLLLIGSGMVFAGMLGRRWKRR
jgi:PEP-CTERM motif